jgi:ATP synthase subunit 6
MLITYSPLEQFLVLPILSIIPNFLTINNIFITFFVLFSSLAILFCNLVKPNTTDIYLVPNRYQLFFENIFFSILSVIQDNIQSDEKKKFFPIIGAIFFLILNLNLFGIIPYTFTVTSELIITFALSLLIFIGIQIIAVRIHKLKFFSLFFPSGVSVLLSFLLVPIEFISFFFKPISLSIRLFANMMAGHTLLKVIAGFTWLIMGATTFFSLAHYIPLLILIVLFVLEVGVAIIQSFVFAVLLCIYINDIFNLH